MKAIRIRKRIDSEALHLPELKEMLGKMVEIIVLEESSDLVSPPGDLSFFMALAPKRKPQSAADMAELRAAAKHDKALAAALEIAELGGIDANAIAELRAASMV